MWPTVHLSKDEDHFQRVVCYLTSNRSRKFSPQCRIWSKPFKRKNCTVWQNNWIGQKALGKSFALLDQGIYEQQQSTVYVLSDSLLCLSGKCQPHPQSGAMWWQGRSASFLCTQEYRELYGCWVAGRVRVEDLRRTHEVQKMLQSDSRIRWTSGIGSSLCRCTTTRGATMTCANKIQRTYLRLPNYFWQDGDLPRTRRRTKAAGRSLTNLTGSGTVLQMWWWKTDACAVDDRRDAHDLGRLHRRRTRRCRVGIGGCWSDMLDKQCRAQEPAVRRSQRALEWRTRPQEHEDVLHHHKRQATTGAVIDRRHNEVKKLNFIQRKGTAHVGSTQCVVVNSFAQTIGSVAKSWVTNVKKTESATHSAVSRHHKIQRQDTAHKWATLSTLWATSLKKKSDTWPLAG